MSSVNIDDHQTQDIAEYLIREEEEETMMESTEEDRNDEGSQSGIGGVGSVETTLTVPRCEMDGVSPGAPQTVLLKIGQQLVPVPIVPGQKIRIVTSAGVSLPEMPSIVFRKNGIPEGTEVTQGLGQSGTSLTTPLNIKVIHTDPNTFIPPGPRKRGRPKRTYPNTVTNTPPPPQVQAVDKTDDASPTKKRGRPAGSRDMTPRLKKGTKPPPSNRRGRPPKYRPQNGNAKTADVLTEEVQYEEVVEEELVVGAEDELTQGDEMAPPPAPTVATYDVPSARRQTRGTPSRGVSSPETMRASPLRASPRLSPMKGQGRVESDEVESDEAVGKEEVVQNLELQPRVAVATSPPDKTDEEQEGSSQADDAETNDPDPTMTPGADPLYADHLPAMKKRRGGGGPDTPYPKPQPASTQDTPPEAGGPPVYAKRGRKPKWWLDLQKKHQGSTDGRKSDSCRYTSSGRRSIAPRHMQDTYMDPPTNSPDDGSDQASSGEGGGGDNTADTPAESTADTVNTVPAGAYGPAGKPAWRTYACNVCHKVYRQYGRMVTHLRAFPTHSCSDDTNATDDQDGTVATTTGEEADMELMKKNLWREVCVDGEMKTVSFDSRVTSRRTNSVHKGIRGVPDCEIIQAVQPVLVRGLSVFDFLLMKAADGRTAAPSFQDVYTQYERLHNLVKQTADACLAPPTDGSGDVTIPATLSVSSLEAVASLVGGEHIGVVGQPKVWRSMDTSVSDREIIVFREEEEEEETEVETAPMIHHGGGDVGEVMDEGVIEMVVTEETVGEDGETVVTLDGSDLLAQAAAVITEEQVIEECPAEQRGEVIVIDGLQVDIFSE